MASPLLLASYGPGAGTWCALRPSARKYADVREDVNTFCRLKTHESLSFLQCHLQA